MLKKAVVWVTLISFTLSCSGCHSLFEGNNCPSKVTYAGETQTTPLEEIVGAEFVISVLILALLITAAATGNMHGYYSTGHNFDFHCY